MAIPDSPDAIAVYCGSSIGKSAAFESAVKSLGQALVKDGRGLVYGGGNDGIMGVVASSVLQAGGRVTGVIPYAMHSRGGEGTKTEARENGAPVNEPPPFVNPKMETIVVHSMHERKVEMAKRVAGFVGLPGGYGTFEEIMEVTTWTQLGIHTKPVVLVNVLGYYDPLRQMIKTGVESGFISVKNESLITFVDGPEDRSLHESFDWGAKVLEALNDWDPSQVPSFGLNWSKKMGLEQS